jgi:long-chain acyl-CoA synthetase
MKPNRHFLDYLQTTIRRDWKEPAMTDYDDGGEFTYGEMAERIARIHVLFKAIGLKKGDKVALCGRNSSHWAIAMLATVSYEAVAVSIMDAFTPESIYALVKHSDARVFMVGDVVWKNLKEEELNQVDAIICQNTLELYFGKNNDIKNAHASWDKLFKAEYPNGFDPTKTTYSTDNFDEPAIINYTSGSTGDPKGVVLTHRNISSNVTFGQDKIPNQAGWSVVSMLPLAHMFGLTFEFLYQLAGGCHVYFLNRTPSPQVLLKALSEVHPYMILTVPLVIEKIFKKSIFPAIQKPLVKVLWYLPGINKVIRRKVYNKLMQAFGGNLKYLIIGGAALNHEVEKCLKQIKFPYCVGYGMTECAPLIAYTPWDNFKIRSCGKIVDRMEVKVDSENPQKVVGEIMVKGESVMNGYYKNQAATDAIFTKDGWMKTGDLGVIDADGNIFIRGRNKNMILSGNGQNIYPEEIEDKVNNMPYVIESVVVSRGGNLVALVYADTAAIKKETTHTPQEIMDMNCAKVNKLIPRFCKISSFELVEQEFAKTPKKSIKRYLYN